MLFLTQEFYPSQILRTPTENEIHYAKDPVQKGICSVVFFSSRELFQITNLYTFFKQLMVTHFNWLEFGLHINFEWPVS